MMARRRSDGLRRVAVVAPAVVPHDAISAAAADTCRMLMGMEDLDVRLLTTWCTMPGLPVVQVPGVAEMLCHPAYLGADLLIYHFGVHHPLFDAILVGNGHALQVVRFHNVTPPELLEASDRRGIDLSLRQMHNLERADMVWGDSRTNLQALQDQSIMPRATEVLPLVVDAPVRSTLAGKRARQVEILYLGRFVRSKGVLELIEALRMLARREHPKFRLRLVGNEAYSNPDYLAQVHRAASELGPAAEFLGQMADAERDELLRESHLLAIPSYHEGFCKPVVEALRAGCVPVGFAAYNLPDICAGLGRLVTPGDVIALSDALSEVLEDLEQVISGHTSTVLRLDGGRLPIGTFDSRALEHTSQFEREALQARTRNAVNALMQGGTKHAV